MVVVATAAPAMAASGPAAVTTAVAPTTDTNAMLPVTITFTNANTGSTGATSVAVTFARDLGFVVNAEPTNVSAGWQYESRAGDAQNRSFTFSTTTAAGIAGASSPAGTQDTVLSFTIQVNPNNRGESSGTINVAASPTSGTVAPGAGAWT